MTTPSLKRHPCRSCPHSYALRKDGTIRMHGPNHGDHCPGSRQPPAPGRATPTHQRPGGQAR